MMRASRLFSLLFLVGLACLGRRAAAAEAPAAAASGTNGGQGRGSVSREAALTGPVVPAVSKELTTESRILYGQAIGAGREVLFRLERAPYWQRLSLAEGTWLPLPPGDLSGCHLAGNKDAIFVLNPALREILRYNSTTLVLEKMSRLPDNGMTYHGLAAGCLTDDAPLAVMSDHGAVPCDPKELTLDFYPVQHSLLATPLEAAFDYQASGDGTRVYCRPSGPPGRSRIPDTLRYVYHGPLRGFEREHANENDKHPTVSASCSFSPNEGILYPGSGRRPHKNLVNHFGDTSLVSLVSSPNLCVITRGDARTTPAVPAQCTFYSYYSETPWATVEVPEAGDVKLMDGAIYAGRLWLDPASLTLAVWHLDQKLTLHTLEKAAVPQTQTPVLLNYPDCYVPRGTAFHFKPQVLGTAAQPSATETPADFTVGADGSMDWQAPQLAAQAEAVLRVKLAGGEAASEFQIALQLGGEQPVVAVSPTVVEAVKLENNTRMPPAKKGGYAKGLSDEDKIENEKEAFASALKIGFALPLKSRLYRSDTPIETVLPGLDDYLALQMKDKSLALFSVREWKVAGSQMLGDTSIPFMGGDAVYLYDTLTRLLTRHALPGFALTHRYQVPGNARLVGLAVGETASGPLTLALEEMNRGSLLVLDKQTLTATKWAPYAPPADSFSATQLLAEMLRKESTVQIPASSDGRLVLLPGGVLMISAALTTDFSHANRAQSWSGIQLLNESSAAPKIDGIFSAGRGFFRGYPHINVPMDDKGNVLSHCGSYYTSSKTVDHGTKINFFATDDARLLLRLDCVEVLDFPDAQVEGSDRHRQVVPMGEKNLVTVISRGGSMLQVIALDMAAVSRAIHPGSAHVTSHPNPIVLEGRTLEYQLALNNPAGVASYQLIGEIPGASINNLGHFTFRAPPKLEKPMQLNIVIQLHLKSGLTALHKFPLYVLPLPGAAAKTKQR